MGAIEVIAILLGVVVLLWLVLRMARRGTGTSPTSARPRPSGTLSAEAAAEALGLARAGKKIHAIKLVREHTGWGLAEAKDAVERLEREGLASATASASAAPGPRAPAELNELELEGIRSLVAEGQTIEAVKLVRERTGLGLAEAKALVDGLGEG